MSSSPKLQKKARIKPPPTTELNLDIIPFPVGLYEVNAEYRGNSDEESVEIFVQKGSEIDISDRGNTGAIVPYSEERDISKFILVPLPNDPLTEEVNLKITGIRMQLKMQDERLTARGAEDGEKMAKYCRLYRKLMHVHVKSLQSAAPPPPKNTASQQPLSLSSSLTSSSDHHTEFPNPSTS